MLWWLLVIVSALALTGQDLVKKSILTKEHAHVMATTRAISIAALGFFLLPFIDAHLPFEPLFFLYLASLATCFAVLYSTKALKHLEISVLAPMDNLGPAFLVLFAFVFLHEVPAALQFVGIGLLAVGAYLLEVRPGKHSYLDPLRIMLTSRHIHYFLFSMVILTGLAIFEKVFVVNFLTPVTYMFFFFLFFMVNFVVLHWYRFGLDEVREEFVLYGQKYFFGAVFSIIAGLTYLFALVTSPVTLVVSLRRASTLFTTVIGGRMFKEENSVMKVVACIIMIVGAVLLLR